MTSGQAKSLIGLPVKVVAHQAYPHYATGQLIRVEGDQAIIKGKFDKFKRVETESRFDVQFVRRWPQGERQAKARLHTIAVASAAAEIQGAILSERAGLSPGKSISVCPAGRFAEKAEHFAAAADDTNGVAISVKYRNGGLMPGDEAMKLKHVDICPKHGEDLPCNLCAGEQADEVFRKAAAPAVPAPVAVFEVPKAPVAPAAVKIDPEAESEPVVPIGDAARHLVMDEKSGRVWGGTSYGFMDGAGEPERAIRYARGLHAIDARKYLSRLKNGNVRAGQYWRDGLVVVTEARAMEILTEPGRVFTPPPPPIGEVSGDAQEFGRAMAAMAERLQGAAAEVARHEREADECRRAAEAAEETARLARQNAEAAEREARQAREAAGRVKAEMAALIDSQGF